LAEYQNEFNTVMETLNILSTNEMTRLRFEDGSQNIEDYVDVEKKYSDPKNWEEIFLVLQEVGMFTPGIYMQAQKVGFERDKLASFLLMML
jgi:hypothetical protein